MLVSTMNLSSNKYVPHNLKKLFEKGDCVFASLFCSEVLSAALTAKKVKLHVHQRGWDKDESITFWQVMTMLNMTLAYLTCFPSWLAINSCLGVPTT